MKVYLNSELLNLRLYVVLLVPFLLIIFSGCEQIGIFRNDPPKINSFTIPKQVEYGRTLNFKVTVFDPEEDEITYSWSVSDGELKSDSEALVEWTAPALPEELIVPPLTVTVNILIRDSGEEEVSESGTILVYSKAYEVANRLKGVYKLVLKQISGETVDSLGGSMRLTTTTFSRQFVEASQFTSGFYTLIKPFDNNRGTINWYLDGSLQPSVSTYTWDGQLLILHWQNNSITYVYDKTN